jgi:hypothetical protein
MLGQKILTEEEWTQEFGPKELPAAKVAGQTSQSTQESEGERDSQQIQEEANKDDAEEELENVIDNRPPPSDNEVDVCIVFDYKGERWSHKFRVSKGCTVLELKRLMVKSNSPEEDVVSFDLQKRRIRVNNYDTVDSDETFEFQYIGPEEGQKKKEKDKDLKAQRDEQARIFASRYEKTRKDEDAARETKMKEDQDRQRQSEKEAEDMKRREAKEKEQKSQNAVSEDIAEFDPPDDESGSPIVVYVHHLEAEPLKGKTLSVAVPSTASVRYLRRAVCNKIGIRRIADVTIHKKGHTYSQWPLAEDSEPIGSRREFFSRGANLIPAAVPLAPEFSGGSAKAEASPKVTHDTEDDTLDVSVAKGKTVLDLKRAICDRVKRGPYTRIILADGKGNPLADNFVVDKFETQERKQLRLDGLAICAPFQIELRVVHAADVSRVLTVSVDDNASVVEVKQAVMAGRRGCKPADLKFVMTAQKRGATPAPMADSMRLNGKRELFALGKLMDNLSSS